MNGLTPEEWSWQDLKEQTKQQQFNTGLTIPTANMQTKVLIATWRRQKVFRQGREAEVIRITNQAQGIEKIPDSVSIATTLLQN